MTDRECKDVSEPGRTVDPNGARFAKDGEIAALDQVEADLCLVWRCPKCKARSGTDVPEALGFMFSGRGGLEIVCTGCQHKYAVMPKRMPPPQQAKDPIVRLVRPGPEINREKRRIDEAKRRKGK